MDAWAEVKAAAEELVATVGTLEADEARGREDMEATAEARGHRSRRNQS